MIGVALSSIIIAGLLLINGGLINNQSIELKLLQLNSSLRSKSDKPLAINSDYSSYVPVASAKPNTIPLSTQAKAFIVQDTKSGQILGGNAQNDRLPIASLTKLATALVIAQKHDRGEIITIPEFEPFTDDVAQLKVAVGEKYSVEEVLEAILISSSADVARAAAIWESGSESAFVEKMNTLASQWNMTNTKFDNVTGLDNPNNYSSASDLLILTNLVLSNKTLAAIVSKPSSVITTDSGINRNLVSTNALLNVGSYKGVKTGTTAQAGQCFVALYDNGQISLVSVILGGNNRFIQTRALLGDTIGNYIWL